MVEMSCEEHDRQVRGAVASRGRATLHVRCQGSSVPERA
jgi:hypothetical protein